MSILIKGGRIIDPANKLALERGDILVEEGRISRLAPSLDCPAEEIIDAEGKIVAPALVDMHVHLRQPGREDKETIHTGTTAALKGGITTLLAMPNTQPPIDCPEKVSRLKALIQKEARAAVLISACITRAREGKELVDIAKLRAAGVRAITDDGASVDEETLMLQALQTAKESGLLVICHCEDRSLAKGGVVNLGITSTRMGLRGISSAAEYTRVERDIQLAQRAQAPVHITHISCRESVEIIARAKTEGIQVTCDTAPHYFALNEEAVIDFDTNMKVNPPLRSREDVAAIKQGLKQGIIDAIASDHAPHTENEKDIEFERAEFGTLGLETALAVGITELVQPGILGWGQLLEKMSTNPARILGVERGSLGLGCPAEIMVVAPEREWVVEREKFVSKSRNSAFLGRRLTGVVEYTICGGRIVYRAK